MVSDDIFFDQSETTLETTSYFPQIITTQLTDYDSRRCPRTCEYDCLGWSPNRDHWIIVSEIGR